MLCNNFISCKSVFLLVLHEIQSFSAYCANVILLTGSYFLARILSSGHLDLFVQPVHIVCILEFVWHSHACIFIMLATM